MKEETIWVGFSLRLRHLNLGVYLKVSISPVEHKIVLHSMEILSIHLVELNDSAKFRLDS